jgi:hypothetical protein
MSMHTLARRSGAAVTAGAAAAALTLLSPVAANAAVNTQFAAVGSADANYTGPTIGGSCTLTSAPGTDSVQSSIATFTQGTKHRSVDLDATFASSDNPADTVRVRGHSAADLTVDKAGKDLKSFALGVGASVRITHSMGGSSCDGDGFTGGAFTIEFTEHHKGFLYLTRDTKKPGSVSEFVLVNENTGKLVTLDLYSGGKSHSTSRALLKPGKYVVEIAEAGITTGTAGILLKSGQPVSRKIARTIHLSGVFKRS